MLIWVLIWVLIPYFFTLFARSQDMRLMRLNQQFQVKLSLPTLAYSTVNSTSLFSCLRVHGSKRNLLLYIMLCYIFKNYGFIFSDWEYFSETIKNSCTGRCMMMMFTTLLLFSTGKYQGIGSGPWPSLKCPSNYAGTKQSCYWHISTTLLILFEYTQVSCPLKLHPNFHTKKAIVRRILIR